jgi:hypothetical protein
MKSHLLCESDTWCRRANLQSPFLLHCSDGGRSSLHISKDGNELTATTQGEHFENFTIPFSIWLGRKPAYQATPQVIIQRSPYLKAVLHDLMNVQLRVIQRVLSINCLCKRHKVMVWAISSTIQLLREKKVQSNDCHISEHPILYGSPDLPVSTASEWQTCSYDAHEGFKPWLSCPMLNGENLQQRNCNKQLLNSIH